MPGSIQTDSRDLSNRFFILLLKLAAREKQFGEQSWTAGYKSALIDMFGEDDFNLMYPRAKARIDEEYAKVIPFPKVHNQPL